MLPINKIKWKIINLTRSWEKKEPLSYPLEDNVVECLYDELVEKGEHWDAMNEVRNGDVETNMVCEWSRHYESKGVAIKLPDNSWVGWTYWYGGGKHAEPEAIEWMGTAYELNCKEEEKMVIVRTFELK